MFAEPDYTDGDDEDCGAYWWYCGICGEPHDTEDQADACCWCTLAWNGYNWE